MLNVQASSRGGVRTSVATVGDAFGLGFPRTDVTSLVDEFGFIIDFSRTSTANVGDQLDLGFPKTSVGTVGDAFGLGFPRTDITSLVDVTVSCHDYGAPKETIHFWRRLMEEHPYDPSRTLLIDDNVTVLEAAGAFGIRHLITVSQPDSAKPARSELPYPAFNDLREILPND